VNWLLDTYIITLKRQNLLHSKLLDNSNVTFELQTRTDLATSKNGTDIKKINATIFSGFAAKEDGNASIRVELDNNLECKRF
jgi:hypothetical protein